MGALGAFLMVAAVLIMNMPALARQWRVDRPGVIRTLWLFLAYLIFCLVGIGIGLWLATTDVPGGPARPNALPAITFILSWIFYGCLMLLRTVPRYREPPRWLMRFSVLDIVVLAIIAGSFIAAAAYFA